MKNITITGANGFVGSHILEVFNEDNSSDYNITAACRTPSKLPIWYQGKTSTGDLSDQLYLESITREADVICHTAAWAEMNGSNEDSKKYFLDPTVNLINSALNNGVKRFIFLSAITSNPIEKKEIHSTKNLNEIWPHYDSIIKIENFLREKSHQGMEVIILRAGYFTGKNYALGLLPILLPRLKTHLVPWLENGKTSLPLIDGEDVGLAFQKAATVTLKEDFQIIDVVGKEVPTVKEVFSYLHKKYQYPLPHFSISFEFAYLFARFVRWIHKFLPGEPLIVPPLILLLEETNANNDKAKEVLGYQPKVHWKDSIDIQIAEMKIKQIENMKLNKK